MKGHLHLGEKGYFFRGDRQIWVIVLLLMLISVVEVFSTTASLAYRASKDSSYYLFNQVANLAVGGVAMFLFQMIPMRYFLRLAKPALFLMGTMLFLTLLFGKESNGARRWLELYGVSVQPSVLASIPLILYVAGVLAEKRKEVQKFSFVLFPLVFTIGSICLLILFGSFSAAALLGVTCFLLLIVGNVRWKHLLYIVLLGVGSFFAFVKLAPYLPLPTRVATWASRWDTFWSGTGNTYQNTHAKIAIANGFIWGRGPGNSMQRLVLPDSHDDFIFSIIVEEGGILFGAIVLFLYFWLLYRIYVVMKASRRPYHTYVCAGFGLLILLQAFVHIFISIGWGPVTGLPLPLVSAGGTSILSTCIALGMIQSVARQQKKELYEGEDQDVA